MHLLSLWLINILLGLGPGPGPRSSGSLTELVQQLNTVMKIPAERLDLVTERQRYVPGDRLWFQTFLYQPRTFRPVPWGAYLHVQLRDSRDSLRAQVLVRRDLQAGAGYLDLPSGLAPGPYRLIAFSNYMQNQPGYSYQAVPIWISSTHDGLAAPAPASSSWASDSLRLTPEGGSLVSGFESRVFVRSLDQHANPLGFQAVLLDDHQQVLDSVTVGSDGLGAFVLAPETGRHYRLQGRFRDGKVLNCPVPEMAPSGFALRLQALHAGNLQLTVVPGDSLYGHGMVSYVLVLTGDTVSYAAAGQNAYRLTLPAEALHPGLNRIVVVDTAWTLRASRLLYRPYRAQLQQVSSSSGSRTLLLHAGSGSSEAPAGYLLMGSEPSGVTVPPYEPLWLRGLREQGLEGPVPAAYQDLGLAQEPDSGMLDAFILTQGFKKLDLHEMLSASAIEDRFAPDTSQYIAGRVTEPGGQEVAGARVSLIERAPESALLQTSTNARGQFVFAPIRIPEGAVFMIQATPPHGHKTLTLHLEDSLGMGSSRFPVGLRPWKPEALIRFRDAMHAEDVRVASEHPGIHRVQLPEVRKQADAPVSAQSKGYVVTRKQLESFTDLVQALSVVPGVNASYSPDGSIHIRIHNSFSNSGPADPLLVLDGVPMEGLSMLGNLTPDAIDSMVVLRGSDASIYGVRGGYGAILLYTRKQEAATLSSSGNELHWVASGYEVPEQPLVQDTLGGVNRLWMGGIHGHLATGMQLVLPSGAPTSGSMRLEVLGDEGQLWSWKMRILTVHFQNLTRP